jgi:hypothetical protein
MPLATVTWLFTAGVLAHNAEEVLYLPAWSVGAGRWHARVGQTEFRVAVAILSAALVGIVVAASVAGPGSLPAYLLSGYALAMVLNVLAPHLVATVATRRYMPGTATAILFNLPLGCLLLKRALSENYIELKAFAWAGPVVTLAMVACIPLLFAAGRKVGSGRRGANPDSSR